MTLLALFALFVVLLLLGVPIAIALALASVGLLAATTDFTLYMISQRMFSALDSSALVAIPGFVIAGAIMAHGGISSRLVTALRAWVGHLPGGLAIVTVASCTIFAAMSGSSPATAAAVGGTLIPAMVANGYDKRYAMGVVAASGTLGILSPPSITFVLIGITANESIGRLFIAGVLPGLFMAGVLAAVAIVIARMKGYRSDTRTGTRERWRATRQALPGLLLPVIVLGTIYGGIATPTEAAILSVFYALAIALFVYRELTWRTLREIMRDAAGVTSMIFLIIPAAMTFAMYLTSEQVPQRIAQWVVDQQLGVAGFWIVAMAMFFIMGTFLDAVAIVLITIPILVPIVRALDINMVHFAVATVVNMELAMITPPVGLNLFVVSGVSHAPLGDAVRGVAPFLVAMIVGLIVIVLFPALSLTLTSSIR
ncbi:MAG: TRAP transporter large permease subunit [Acidobacteria bacterium]|nr:TRAP transporter large permease subunit [Acidobacteriota bacterium]